MPQTFSGPPLGAGHVLVLREGKAQPPVPGGKVAEDVDFFSYFVQRMATVRPLLSTLGAWSHLAFCEHCGRLVHLQCRENNRSMESGHLDVPARYCIANLGLPSKNGPLHPTMHQPA